MSRKWAQTRWNHSNKEQLKGFWLTCGWFLSRQGTLLISPDLRYQLGWSFLNHIHTYTTNVYLQKTKTFTHKFWHAYRLSFHKKDNRHLLTASMKTHTDTQECQNANSACMLVKGIQHKITSQVTLFLSDKSTWERDYGMQILFSDQYPCACVYHLPVLRLPASTGSNVWTSETVPLWRLITLQNAQCLKSSEIIHLAMQNVQHTVDMTWPIHLTLSCHVTGYHQVFGSCHWPPANTSTVKPQFWTLSLMYLS